ncbi:hypothetical protein F5Y18DRAFT_430999 [Xylariaceae sp. FL1019]|nr:hypothetical protein F5Y18DRAFT_430999 [Xylariaceae sp. FL1019]
MATLANDTIVFHGPTRMDHMNPEDFETASIRSAAPSYISEAPSYHTLPPNESVPAYTPPATTATNTAAPRRQISSMIPPSVASQSTFAPGAGLPPIPRRAESPVIPSLNQFRIPSWSSVGSGNPQARHYQSVANRRVAAASASNPTLNVEGALRAAMDRVSAANADAGQAEDAGDGRIRPLEDPYLVGEEAAARNRNARLARLNGDEILIREDQRWDWWHAQMSNMAQREASWNAFRSNMENNRGRRFRFGR